MSLLFMVHSSSKGPRASDSLEGSKGDKKAAFSLHPESNPAKSPGASPQLPPMLWKLARFYVETTARVASGNTRAY